MSNSSHILSDSQIDALYADGRGQLEFARKIEAAVLAHLRASTMLFYGGCAWKPAKEPPKVVTSDAEKIEKLKAELAHYETEEEIAELLR